MVNRTATAYYFWLRKQGYKPRTACFSCLMRYSKTETEYIMRGARVGRFLNRVDIARDGDNNG